MKTIGRHVIAEFYGCDGTVLNDVAGIRSRMVRAAELTGATVLGEMFHAFSPYGVSGTVVIAESHLSIHTWPENGYVAVDIYTCGGLDPRIGFDYLYESLGAKQSRIQEILRGLPEDIAGHQLLLPEDVQVVTRTGRLHEAPIPEPIGEPLVAQAS